MSRDGLLTLARAGAPWAFVGLGVQAIEQSPDDDQLRALLASNLAALGLRTPTLEHLAALSAPATREPEVASLAQRAGALPDDQLQPGRLTRSVRAACEVLAARGVDLRERVSDWRRRIEGEQWLQANDGNIVRRGADGRWISLADDRADAASMDLPQIDPDGRPSPDRCEGPFVFDGLAGPWLLLRVWETTPITTCGYQPRITVVESSVDALFDALAMADLRAVCADPRVEWLVGDDAVERFERLAERRADSILAGPVFTAEDDRAGRATEIVRNSAARQRAESAELEARLAERSAGRDVAWWRRRYEAALAGGDPLRVLIPTTVHSTFLRHSAEDLAVALRSQGFIAEVLTEDDSHSRMAGLAYLRAAVQLDPDLVLSLNTTRRQMHGVVPPNTPFVCWIQDRMARLFHEEEGRAQGRLDFLVGHMFGELFARFGYPRDRAWSQPVPVSSVKFTGEPASAELLGRFACDVAYVSHQSEPAESMLDRFCAACRDTPLMERFLRELFPLLVEAVEAPGDTPYWKRWEAAGVTLLLRDARFRAVQRPALWAEFCAPLAERIIRMQTLEWAADICRRRGWRMRLFGKGWERHPTLGDFASGPLEHGEVVRAAYQAARVHLHASTQTGSHQRVFECALSGGLMLRRIAVGDLAVAEQEIARDLAEQAGATIDGPFGVQPGSSTAFDRYNARRIALGFEPSSGFEIGETLMQSVLQRPPAPIAQVIDLDLTGSEATAFLDREGLETRLERAIADDAWREGEIARLRSWVRERYTYERMAADLPRRVLAGLRSEPCWRGNAP
ncbi:MAG: hypothetical protein ACF8QF_02375 [Phycisphaerales bacterium]